VAGDLLTAHDKGVGGHRGFQGSAGPAACPKDDKSLEGLAGVTGGEATLWMAVAPGG
jgi:hypothetical protein